MFDVSFTELLVIGVVALVVIGPERLPKVARTLGLLVGRAQRYVNDVKTDIQREVELDELRQLKNQMQDAAQSVQSSLQNTESALRKPLESLEQDVSALKQSFAEAEVQAMLAPDPLVSATAEPEPVAIPSPEPVVVPVPATAPVSIPTQLELGAVAPAPAPAPTPSAVPVTATTHAPNQTSVASTTPGSAS
jgi:sec-independent protein translocase protein TatB